MTNKKFLKRDSSRFSKFGKKRKKMQKWKRPKGRDNKMREKRRGYPVVVSVGYKQSKETRKKINGKSPVRVLSVKEVKSLNKENVVIIGNVGKKKKMEIAKIAEEKGIEILNLNVKKFLKEKKEAKKWT